MSAFVVSPLSRSLSPTKLPSVSSRAHKSRCLARRSPARASLLPPAGLVLADDIFGEIARGGFGIILSGIGGAFIAALLIRSNYDEIEANFQARNDNVEVDDDI